MGNRYFSIEGKKYYLDFEKIREIWNQSKNDILTDVEITDVSSLDDEANNEFVNQKIIKENKYCNTQTDVLMQDIVKACILGVLEIETLDSDDTTFGEMICFNTCLKFGIIKEIN